MNTARIGAHVATAISMALAARYGLISAGVTPNDLIRQSAPIEALVDGGVRAIGAAFLAWLGSKLLQYPYQAWREGAPGKAVVVFLCLVAAWVVTLIGSIGTIATDTEKASAKIVGAQRTIEDARNALARVDNQLRELPSSRPAETVEAAIRVVKLNPIYTASDSCRQPQYVRGAIAHCTSLEKLNEELGIAHSKAKLSAQADELRKHTGAAVGAANAQAKTLTTLLGIDPDQSQALYALLYALAFEFGAIGLNLFASMQGAEPKRAAGYPVIHNVPQPVMQLAAPASYPVIQEDPAPTKRRKKEAPVIEMKEEGLRRFVVDDAAAEWAAGR